jgi:signal transduction histidine kinase
MDSPLKILIVEDFEEDADLLKINLRRQHVLFESRIVDNREDFLKELDEFIPDLILSDHQLPQFDSHEALQLCREKFDSIPFILVTGTVSEEFAVQCIKEGADDYILKSNLARLSSAIKAAINQRHAERKRKEAEEELKWQNQELIKLNGELDSFVYRVSHNLRAPLTSVLGLIQLSKLNGVTPEESGNYLALMEQSIVKLDNTIKGILDYSKNTRKELQYEEIDLGHVITECISNFRYLDGFELINITQAVRGQAPFFSDTQRLTFILDNLISNSIKFSKVLTDDPGFIKVTAEITAEKAVIAVEDNGEGIEPEHLGKVFDMFFKTSPVGAGLGLYIVKESVEKLGGRVDLKSERDKGTQVTVEVPNQLKA